MTRTAYMTAAATAITQATGVTITDAHAEALLGECWDVAQRESTDVAQFSACMQRATVAAARMVRDLAA